MKFENIKNLEELRKELKGYRLVADCNGVKEAYSTDFYGALLSGIAGYLAEPSFSNFKIIAPEKGVE